MRGDANVVLPLSSQSPGSPCSNREGELIEEEQEREGGKQDGERTDDNYEEQVEQ